MMNSEEEVEAAARSFGALRRSLVRFRRSNSRFLEVEEVEEAELGQLAESEGAELSVSVFWMQEEALASFLASLFCDHSE